MTSPAVPAPLHQRRPLVLADLIPGTLVRDILLVVGGAALTGVLAQVAIPVAGSPVPITGQTFGALTVGAVLGWQRAGLSMLLYLVAGMAGVGWFADRSSGYDIPSLGYVIGFVFAATLVGALASRGGDRTPLRVIGTMVLGNAVIYAIGVPYLAQSLGIDLQAAWEIGMKNYLLGDAIKILLAAGCLPLAWRAMDRLHRDD
jgi:biotin transport system substrate-specific component